MRFVYIKVFSVYYSAVPSLSALVSAQIALGENKQIPKKNEKCYQKKSEQNMTNKEAER